jgi:hypothetical protein
VISGGAKRVPRVVFRRFLNLFVYDFQNAFGLQVCFPTSGLNQGFNQFCELLELSVRDTGVNPTDFRSMPSVSPRHVRYGHSIKSLFRPSIHFTRITMTYYHASGQWFEGGLYRYDREPYLRPPRQKNRRFHSALIITLSKSAAISI